MSCKQEKQYIFQKTWKTLWLFNNLNCPCNTVKIYFFYFFIKWPIHLLLLVGSFLFLSGIKCLWNMLLWGVFPNIVKGRTGNSRGFTEICISLQGQCPSYLCISCRNFPLDIWQQPGCPTAEAQWAVGKGKEYSALPGPCIKNPKEHLQCYFPARVWSPPVHADLGGGNNCSPRNTNVKLFQIANYSKVQFSP